MGSRPSELTAEPTAFPPRDVFVAIAAYNERNAIGAVVAGLVERGYSVVVVDDGSADDTAVEARRAGAIALSHVLNRGQGAALQSAMSYAVASGARAIVTFDADGQHTPDDIPALLRPLEEGRADAVLGSRFLADPSSIPAARRLLLRAATVFTRLMSGVRVTDAHNGLRAFTRSAAQRIDLHLDRMAHASEIIDQIRSNRIRFVEVPVHIQYTAYSLAKGQRAGSAFRVAFDYLVNKLLT